jgi:hypothetical protein
MRKIRALLTRLEKELVDDFCRQDGQFKSNRTRERLEEAIEEALQSRVP